MQTQNTSQIGRVVVCALRRFDRCRFKADWAHEPALQEAGPQETWWALEDLWTRLSMCTA